MRERITHALLWVMVVTGGLVLGAKLFDLRVLVGAWSLSPPESLSLLPYGPRWPVDTGDFFIPLSGGYLLACLAALITSWPTPLRYRGLILIAFATCFFGLVITVTEMWPRNAALWAVAKSSPKALQDKAAIVQMVREWVTLDWARVTLVAIGFVAAIRAISVPFPDRAQWPQRSAGRIEKLVYLLSVVGVVAFLVYFVGEVL